MNLYAQYIKEREGHELIALDFGFASYKVSEKELFIVDMFVEQASRMQGLGKKLLEEIFKTALKNNCELITANIHLWDPNSQGTLKAALAVGFKVVGANNNVLLVAKQISGD